MIVDCTRNASERLQTLFDVLERRAREKANSTAYVFLTENGSRKSLTFAGLLTRVQAIATRLQSRLNEGQRAVLMYQPSLDFVEAILACFACGAVAVPIQPVLNPRALPRLVAVLDDAGCNLLLTSATTGQTIGHILPDLQAMLPGLDCVYTDLIPDQEAASFSKPALQSQELAFLQYTSGSTGAPKGVMVSHGNLLSNEAAIRTAFGHDDNSTLVVVGWLPLYHDMGLIGNVFQPLYVGMPSVLFEPMTFLMSPVSWLKAISDWRATTSGAPSFAYELCVHRVAEEEMQGVDLSSWRVAYNGAEPVKAHVIDAFTRKFRPYGFKPEAFYPCYGMAEATLFVTGGSPGAPVTKLAVDPHGLAENLILPQPDSTAVLVGCGSTHGGHEVRIVSPETLETLPENRVGEVWVSGPSVAGGYWGKPELSETTFRARTEEGAGPYLRTGDLGFLRSGELFITGRLKDVIIVRGQNHYPDDIETTVYHGQRESLRELGTAAFAIDTESGVELVVVTELKRQLVAKLDERLRRAVMAKARKSVADAHGLRLHDLVLIKPATLPKTSSGKIRRSYCRELYLNGGLERVEVRGSAQDVTRRLVSGEA